MSLRLTLTAAALAAASACLAVALCRLGAGDLATLVREANRGEAMTRRLATTRRVSEGKHHVVAELIAGRITLREAAERFRELNALADDGNDDLIAPFRVVSGEEEALCRNVYFWTEAKLRHRREPGAAEILARLKTEYRQYFDHDPEQFPEASPRTRPSRGSPACPPPARPLPPVPSLRTR